MNLGCWRVSLYLHVSSSSTSDSLAQCHAFETNNVTDTTLDRSVNSYTAMSQLMADSRVFSHSSLEILIIHIHQATLNYMATYTLCLLTKQYCLHYRNSRDVTSSNWYNSFSYLTEQPLHQYKLPALDRGPKDNPEPSKQVEGKECLFKVDCRLTTSRQRTVHKKTLCSICSFLLPICTCWAGHITASQLLRSINYGCFVLVCYQLTAI